MTIWDWLAAVNAEGGKGFAGHSDWRIPNVKELQSLVDYSVVNSSTAGSGPNTMLVDPVFNTPGMFNGCTLSECSVTGQRYQSSTHAAGNPGYVWGVDFAACYIGVVGPCGKTQVMGDGLVRAVRG